MSRYRDDRDERFGEREPVRRRRESFFDDDRPAPRGGLYERDARPYREEYEREGFYDRPRPDFYEDDYGRRRRYDEDERTVLARSRRSYDDERDERGEGHSILDEGRKFFRRTFGGERGPARRGPSRSHVRCRDIMTRDVTVATRETMLEEVARMMRDEDTGVIPVVERENASLTDLGESRPDINRVQPNVIGSSGKLIGLITDRDIVVRAIAEGKNPATTRAEEIMTTDIHTAQPNDRVIEAIRKMGDKQVRRIPIVDRDATLRGIISMADVALETEDDRELAEALEEISSGSSFWNRVFS